MSRQPQPPGLTLKPDRALCHPAERPEFVPDGGIGRKDERGGSEAASFYVSVPVWPSGDWLPFLCIERATQVHGWFGLAGNQFPAEWLSKHHFRTVQELARQAEPLAAFPASVRGVAADGMADRREVRPDLMGAAGLEPNAQQRRAREPLENPEVGHCPAG